MKTEKYDPVPLILNEGYSLDLHYNNYAEMVNVYNADNWEQYCNFQLLPHACKGHHQILHLHSMQLFYVKRSGGMMNKVGTPKGYLSFAVVEESAGNICFDRIKPKTGDIVFFDDKRPYNFMTSDDIKLCVVNIQKDKMGDLLPLVSQALMHTIYDTDGVMSKTLRDIWKRFTDQTAAKKEVKDFTEAEKEIKVLLLKLLREQTPAERRLTKGENIALTILDRTYGNMDKTTNVVSLMDKTISVASLAKEYQISEKTLGNSFKSLFGFTPTHFLRQLKLNLIHNELKKSKPDQTTVSNVARTWGFTHMGRFARYYRELFDRNPSQTLKQEFSF